MKYTAIIILISLFSLSSCSSKAQDKQKVEQEKSSETSYFLLGPKEFKKKLDTEESPQLIDVRTIEEYNSGSIKNAENYDILNGSFEKQIPNLDKTKTVYVFCAKGGRSGRASALLKEKGFLSIVDLKGGYTAWAQTEK